jgi:hypothetical protein
VDLNRLCKRSRRGAGGSQRAASLHTVHEATVERLPATADLFRLRSPAAAVAVAAQEEQSRGGAQISSSSSSSSSSMLRLTLVADSLPRQLVQRLVACLRALAQPEAEGGVASEALAASVMERLLRGGEGEGKGEGSQGAASAAASASAVAAAAAAAAVLRAGTVSPAFPSWNRSILTEIYLCHACSYQSIEDGNAWAGGTSPWAVVGARGCAATEAPPQCVCGQQQWGGSRQPISNGRCCQRRQWPGEDGGMRSR